MEAAAAAKRSSLVWWEMAYANGAARVTERTEGMASVVRIKSVDSGDAQTLGEIEVAVETGQERK